MDLVEALQGKGEESPNGTFLWEFFRQVILCTDRCLRWGQKDYGSLSQDVFRRKVALIYQDKQGTKSLKNPYRLLARAFQRETTARYQYVDALCATHPCWCRSCPPLIGENPWGSDAQVKHAESLGSVDCMQDVVENPLNPICSVFGKCKVPYIDFIHVSWG